MDLLFLLLMFVVLYFVILRPQQKRQREAAMMLASLEVGDDVITVGGLFGTVVAIDDDSVDLRVGEPGPVLRFRRDAVGTIVRDEDLDSLDSEESVEDPVTQDVIEDRVDDPAKGGQAS